MYGTPPPAPTCPGRSEDDVAIDRYRYLLRTAPPEAVVVRSRRLTDYLPQHPEELAELGAFIGLCQSGASR
ncbi:hypothetical protein D3C74_459820 [compost metagenome]